MQPSGARLNGFNTASAAAAAAFAHPPQQRRHQHLLLRPAQPLAARYRVGHQDDGRAGWGVHPDPPVLPDSYFELQGAAEGREHGRRRPRQQRASQARADLEAEAAFQLPEAGALSWIRGGQRGQSAPGPRLGSLPPRPHPCCSRRAAPQKGYPVTPPGQEPDETVHALDVTGSTRHTCARPRLPIESIERCQPPELALAPAHAASLQHVAARRS